MNLTNVSQRVHARSLLAACLLLICAHGAYGADTYNPATKQLTMAAVSIGSAIYANMVVTVGSIVTGPTGTAPNASVDIYNPTNGQLTVPSVMLGGTAYFNVIVTVADLVSIGSVTGVDTFNGADLTIAFIELPELRAGVVLAITVGNVVRVAGGMPTSAFDTYDSQTRELTIAAVEVNGRVYTNVTITAGGGNLVSKGSPACFSPCTLTQPGSVSFTVPAGVSNITVGAWGGGGASGAGAASASGGTIYGGGGGGGAYLTHAISVVPETTYTATVGSGGNSTAANGGSSNLSQAGTTLVSAGGGQAGGAATASMGGAGGAGGVASGGESGGNGEAGSNTAWFSGSSCAEVGGNGGNGANGGAGGIISSGSIDSCASGGINAVAPGGGGQGGNASPGPIGFNGASGQIIAIWAGGGAATLSGS
jgi:hypothetical protein